MRNSEVFREELSAQEIVALPNKDLYALCKTFGFQSRRWQRQFAFLLPEVARRGLHRRYGCESIYYFAAKIGGIGHEVVYRVLCLHKRLSDKPLIWNQFRKFGWGKLQVVAGLVRMYDQEFWLDKLEKLPKSALQEYVKCYRARRSEVLMAGDGEGSGLMSGASQDGNSLKQQFDFESKSCGTKNEDAGAFKGLDELKNAGALQKGNEITGWENVQDESGVGYEITGKKNQCDNGEGAGNCKLGGLAACGSVESSRPKTFNKLKFNVDSQTEFKFKKLKQLLEKQRGAVTMGEVLKYALDRIEELERKIVILEKRGQGKLQNMECTGAVVDKEVGSTDFQKAASGRVKVDQYELKGEIADFKRPGSEESKAGSVQNEKLQRKEGVVDYGAGLQVVATRYISKALREALIAKYQGRCACAGCNEPYYELHHRDRFALTKSHENIVPLCRLHHQMAHAGELEGEDKTEFQEIDEKVRVFWADG